MPDATANGPQFTASPQPLTIDYAQRSIVMYHLSGLELDGIAGGGNPLHPTFFGVSAGALISLSAVIFSTPIAEPKAYATFVALDIAALVGAIVFGINFVNDCVAVKRRLKEIKSGRQG
jgi:hypothetical protein